MTNHIMDATNYYCYIEETRQALNKRLDDLGKGLYLKDRLWHIEQGECAIDKMHRDRLMARLGISQENYVDYLHQGEYDDWAARQNILNSLENEEVALAKNQLQEYESAKKRDDVDCQFVETVRAMIQELEGAPREEIRQTLETALAYTVPDIETALEGEMLLAEQEVDLLIEWVRYQEESNQEEKNRKILQYESIASRVARLPWDMKRCAKIEPKLAYYICYLSMSAPMTAQGKKECRMRCDQAVALLRRTGTTYYRSEVSACNPALRGKQELPAPSMHKGVYIYREKGGLLINEIIQRSRRAAGLTQREMGEDICSRRTLIRAETTGKLRPYTLRMLLDRAEELEKNNTNYDRTAKD